MDEYITGIVSVTENKKCSIYKCKNPASSWYGTKDWQNIVCVTHRGKFEELLDHIISIHNGGSDTLNNVRATHKKCNESRTHLEEKLGI